MPDPDPTATPVLPLVPEVGATPSATAVAMQTPQPTPDLVSQADPAPEEAPVRIPGGTLRLTSREPTTLDPHLSFDTVSGAIVVEIFSGLVTLDTDLEVVPDIAESWTVENRVLYTFRLRPDARFHDGRPVTAHDFKWSLERALSPRLDSQVAPTYLDDIVGAQEVLSGETSLLAGVRVVDDYTLQIQIDRPKSYFLAKLTFPTAFVLDRVNVQGRGREWYRNANGTGPFKLTTFARGELIVLERHDELHGQPAWLDRVEYLFTQERPIELFQADEIDFAEVGLFDLDIVLEPEGEFIEYVVSSPPKFILTYIGFNVNEPPFDDPKFRQALSLAVDRESMFNGGLPARDIPAYGILPPGFPGHDAGFEGIRFDDALGRRLLNESEYVEPLHAVTITLSLPDFPDAWLVLVTGMWGRHLGVATEFDRFGPGSVSEGDR